MPVCQAVCQRERRNEKVISVWVTAELRARCRRSGISLAVLAVYADQKMTRGVLASGPEELGDAATFQIFPLGSPSASAQYPGLPQLPVPRPHRGAFQSVAECAVLASLLATTSS